VRTHAAAGVPSFGELLIGLGSGGGGQLAGNFVTGKSFRLI
jgi:hypothetical protein